MAGYTLTTAAPRAKRGARQAARRLHNDKIINAGLRLPTLLLDPDTPFTLDTFKALLRTEYNTGNPLLECAVSTPTQRNLQNREFFEHPRSTARDALKRLTTTTCPTVGSQAHFVCEAIGRGLWPNRPGAFETIGCHPRGEVQRPTASPDRRPGLLDTALSRFSQTSSTAHATLQVDFDPSLP